MSMRSDSCFDDRYKDGEEIVFHDGWLLFVSGAARENTGWGQCIKPPSDPLKRAINIQRYWRERVVLESDRFQDCREQIESLLHASRQQGRMPPSEERLDRLKELQKNVRQCKKKLDEATAKVESLTPKHERDDSVDLDIHESHRDFAARLDKLKI